MMGALVANSRLEVSEALSLVGMESSYHGTKIAVLSHLCVLLCLYTCECAHKVEHDNQGGSAETHVMGCPPPPPILLQLMLFADCRNE